MRAIKTVVIHYSASPFGCVSEIRRWHHARGWKDIGYHVVLLNGHVAQAKYVAGLDGAIEIGRPWQEIGAHAKGHNADSLGVCLIGMAADTVTPAQWDALRKFLAMCQVLWPGIEILGHRDLGQTRCPDFDVATWLRA